MSSRHFLGCLRAAYALPLAAMAIALQPSFAAGPKKVAPPTEAQVAPLSPDDVSWLFPPPQFTQDLENTIAMADLTAADPKDSSKRVALWPATAFAQFLANAEGPATQIGSHHLKLPQEAHDIKAWRIAGLRIDPGAPGLTNEIIGQFGRQPQIRFILQPVTTPVGGVKIDDVTAHVIFSFDLGGETPAQPGCLSRFVPDDKAFGAIARDFATLRDELANGHFGGKKIRTAGRLLGVHPGLADPTAAKPLRDALVTVLERHLANAKLTGMAIMGLADGGPEPWVFLAMTQVPPGVVPSLPNGGFIPIHGPALDGVEFAEALAVRETPHEVIPTPAPNNLNPITCKNAALPAGASALPIAERKGLATAALFDLGQNKQTDPKTVAKINQTVDLIADPTRSHFFNTDCVSCHTDTRRALDLLNNRSIAGVDPAVLPTGKWDVRNFGWFPSKPNVATATRRAASETQAVVNFINSKGLAKP